MRNKRKLSSLYRTTNKHKLNLKKEEIREEIKVLRNENLSDKGVADRKSRRITAKLRSIILKLNPKRVFFYIPIKHEVNILELVSALPDSIDIFIPHYSTERNLWMITQLDKNIKIKEFVKIKNNIPQQETCKKLFNNLIDAQFTEEDIAIVPGLGFDRNGCRIGYGEGNYDRYLKQFTGIKIGVAFDFQMVDYIPSEKHDIPVDLILTERASYIVENSQHYSKIFAKL